MISVKLWSERKMIIPTDMAIAFVCPHCGSLVYETFSLFQLKKAEELEIVCRCGQKPCLIGLDREHVLYVVLLGKCCDDPHEFGFYLEEFQENALMGLACDASSLGLGFIGTPRMVKLASEDCVLPIQI